MISKFSNSDGQETTTHTCWGQSPLQGLPKEETFPKSWYNYTKKLSQEIKPRNEAKNLAKKDGK